MASNIINPENVYILNKNEGVLAVFSKDDEDTLIDPEIKEVQNQETIFTFQIPTSSEKWNKTYNPENLYLADGKVFSANFDDSITIIYDEDDTELITVKAYERQKLLEREFAKIYNSTTGYEEVDDTGNPVEGGKIYIDEFMIIILSGGNKPLINGNNIVTSTFEKGTSGYALDALLYGTGWRTGTCDVEGKFDIETDQVDIWNNILQIQETWGGILVVDSLNKIIHHRDETRYLPYSGFEVKEEKNLQTYEYIGKNKIITQLCPLGEGSLNIKSVNDDSVWLTDFSYTDSIYKAIENNDNIFEPEQLKRWGQRKLQELCKPRKELTVTFPLLHRVEGFENEKIGLNHIVDVTNYDLKEDKSSQLRVIEYTHKMWSDEDANIVVGDITLESTDIFKKNVEATNLINNGTLDTSKIIDYYKNGQSLRETLREVDRTIIQTKSEFSKADDEIRASVEQIETDVDTLNNDIVSQSRTIAELSVSVGEINSKVETIADLTEIITGHDGRVVLDKAIPGYLLGLSVHGYEGSFRATYLSEDTVLDENLTLLDTSIVLNVYTKNKCPTSAKYYEQGYYDTQGNKVESKNHLRTKEPFKVEEFSEMYFSVNSNQFAFYDLYFYDEFKEYISSWNELNSDNIINNSTGKNITIPENVSYMNVVFQEYQTVETIADDEEIIEITEILPELITNIKPQLEYGAVKTDFIEYNTQNLEFYLDDELRIAKDDEGNEVYDEFTIIDKNAQLIRRIGVDDEGNNYILTNPEYISYGTIEIPIVQGQNIVEVVHFTPTIIAEYVKQNQYTDLFATNVQVNTIIKQTDQMILLAANKMVSKDGLIKEFNSQIAISPEKILIEGDKISIRSSYFTLTDEGEITATKGTIAGWEIVDNALYKNKSGLMSATEDDDIVFFAGADSITEEGNEITPVDPDIIIRNRGVIDIYPDGVYENLNILRYNSTTGKDESPINLSQAQRIALTKGMRLYFPPNKYNGTGYTDRTYVSTLFTNTGTFHWLANKGLWSYDGIITAKNTDTPDCQAICINNAKSYKVIDILHPDIASLLEIYRVGNNNEASYAAFNTNLGLYVNGLLVSTNTSDQRLKINVMDAVESGLNLIKQILHRRFDWNKNGKHISIGYIAQELMEIDPNFVIYNEKFDTYQIDLLYVLATTTKAIQEEDEKVEKLEKENEKLRQIVKILADKSGCSEEIESILNE